MSCRALRVLHAPFIDNIAEEPPSAMTPMPHVAEERDMLDICRV